jgi:hypothetical protein
MEAAQRAPCSAAPKVKTAALCSPKGVRAEGLLRKGKGKRAGKVLLPPKPQSPFGGVRRKEALIFIFIERIRALRRTFGLAYFFLTLEQPSKGAEPTYFVTALQPLLFSLRPVRRKPFGRA